MSRLVLADDNPTTQKMLDLSLQPEGYEVVPFADGKKALEYILENEVDIVLANISVPGLDGYSLCARLADETRVIKVPVVLLVGALDEIQESKALESGSIAVLRKPFSTHQLLDVVMKARKQVSKKPELVSNLFEIPINESEEAPLFYLSMEQLCSSGNVLEHEYFKSSFSSEDAHIELETKRIR